MCPFIETDEPNLLRHLFPAYRVPRVSFAETGLELQVPGEAWCVDATCSAGLLALRTPRVDQVVELQQRLSQLSRHSGLVRRMEIRVDGSVSLDLLQGALEQHAQDRNCVEPVASIEPGPDCLQWLRGLGLREAGLSLGVSGYVMYPGSPGGPAARAAAPSDLFGIIDTCLQEQIQPRLDLLDVTRADVEGEVIPLLAACLEHLVKQGQGRLKVRLCDSLGVGLPWPEVPVPRSVPRLIDTLRQAFGLQPDQLEFQGSNDMGLALANTLAALINGCAGMVCSVSGAGERSGIAPTELVLLHLDGLFGADCDFTVVQKLHALVEDLGCRPGERYPIWGHRALTSSQVHLTGPGDALAERYAPFDTGRLVSREPKLIIRRASGAAGIRQLIRQHLPAADLQVGDEPVRALVRWTNENGVDPVYWEAIEPRLRELVPDLFDATGTQMDEVEEP